MQPIQVTPVIDRSTVRKVRKAAPLSFDFSGIPARRLPIHAKAEAVRVSKAQAVIEKAVERVNKVLDREPWKKPVDRLPKRIAEAIAAPKIERAEQAEKALEAARKALADKRRVGILRRLTPSHRRQVRELTHAVEDAESKALRDSYSKSDRRDDEERGKAVARDRDRERREWLDRPETKAAQREAEELRLVADVVRDGDPQITAAAAKGDLRQARELAVDRLDEQQRRELEQRMQGYGGAGPRPGARRRGG